MYSTRPNLILGFHGCDRSVVDKVVKDGVLMEPSQNLYDWLGTGIYFWENSPKRALEYAKEAMKRPNSKIQDPAILGAVIDLGFCFDLLDYKNLITLKDTHRFLIDTFGFARLPVNVKPSGSNELLLRHLDRAVIETLHKNRRESNLRSFDSVRAAFFEGDELYENAGFREKNHIQLCIRNPNCIKGYFLPRKRVMNLKLV